MWRRRSRASSLAHDAIVVAGGDGTIHRAVCGLDGAPTPLGLIPMGTGNDFARGCGIPLSPDGAMRRILEGRTRRLDLVRVNDRVYCTVGLVGVGSDSAVAVARLTRPGSRARGAMRLAGDWSYRLVGLAHLLAPRGISEVAGVKGASGELLHAAGPLFAIFVANTKVLGGGLVLPIDADASDGLLDIAVVARMPRLKLLWAFLCFTRGRPVPRGTLSVYRTSARGHRLRARGAVFGRRRPDVPGHEVRDRGPAWRADPRLLSRNGGTFRFRSLLGENGKCHRFREVVVRSEAWRQLP